MVTSRNCIDTYGYPNINMERKHMVLWDVPNWINNKIPAVPNKIYCNRALVARLQYAFELIIANCLEDEIKTWDGCFNIRKKRGLNSWSLHSWAIAIDINAAWNGLGKKSQMSRQLVACFKKAGFDWGGDWKRKDGMHFQLATL